jgi:hypothetical protein
MKKIFLLSVLFIGLTSLIPISSFGKTKNLSLDKMSACKEQDILEAHLHYQKAVL